MAPKRKHLVLSELYLPDKGGHVIWLQEVCRLLGGATVLTARRPDLPTRERIDGVDVRRIRLGRWALLRPESLALYANLALQGVLAGLREPADVILAARVLPEGAVACAVGAALGVPAIVFAHGEEISRLRRDRPLPDRRRLTTAGKRAALWAAYRLADRVIANSHFTRGLLVAGGVSPARVAVIHPGTDADFFRPLPRDPRLVSQWGLEGKRVILTLGRLRERKGQDMTLRAMPEILRHVGDAVYVIAGTGPHEPQLRRLAEALGLAERVRFVGEVAPAQMPAVYSLADVFVMANRTLTSRDVEGFGIVFLEAAACGVPVVGGRSGGVGDAVADGQTGLLVDGARPEQIARAVVRILGDAQLARRLGEAGRRRVCEGLTWRHSAERVAALVEEVCRAGRSGGLRTGSR